VKITKLTSTDAFVVVDLPSARVASGIVRCAKKILQDGAVNLARTQTYTYAAFGMQRSGASAGINADGAGRNAAVAAFVDELGPRAAAGELVLDAGKGLAAEELVAWRVGDPRVVDRGDADGSTLATGVVAAAHAALGGLGGRTIVVEEGAVHSATIASAFTTAGASVSVAPTSDALVSECDVLCVGSKVGLIDHDIAAALRCALVVPTAALPITARGLAVAGRAGVRVLADFVTTAAPTLVAWDRDAADVSAANGNAFARISEVVTAAAAHPEGDLLGACYLAEEFLRTWCDELPFGRPLA